MLLEKSFGSILLFLSALIVVGCIIITALYLLQYFLMANPRSFLSRLVSFHRKIKRTRRRFFLLFLQQVTIMTNDQESHFLRVGHFHYQSFQIVRRVFSLQFASSQLLILQ